MLFTSEWMSHIFPNHFGVDEHQVIEQVVTDSRAEAKASLFIPIVGENFNGHDFVEQAINNGAVALLWDRAYTLPGNIRQNISVFFVDDTLQAMQELASVYRDKIDPIVVGITGSNGKTTTKDLVRQVVQSSYRTHYTHGNLNNHIGLPLTILGMDANTQVLILEMGMNHFGEIEQLSMIARPDYSIITNIGESHIEYLGSRKGIARAKLEILTGMKKEGTILIDGDEPLLEDIEHGSDVIRCGFRDHNDVIVAEPIFGARDMSFTLSNGYTYSIPLLGKHNALNATFAIKIGNFLDIDNQQINHMLKSLEQTSMRFESKMGPNDVTLINDAYNASPTSMKAAIEVVKQLPNYTNKVLVLGDILELGDDSESYHESIAQVIDDDITAVYTYGERANVITSNVGKKTQTVTKEHFHSKEELVKTLQAHLTNDTVILFKASRGMQFETLIDSIQMLT